MELSIICPGQCLFAKLPQCPVALVHALPYPSVFFTFALTAVVSFVFLLIVGCKYNSVRVFDHKIRTPSISNTLWILFYLFIFLEAVLQAIRFAVKQISYNTTIDWQDARLSLPSSRSNTLAQVV